ncbi:MAG TPA: HAD family hydrolase [Firmicutes bacterium]|jgi:phosphoglycolate phosphatase/pyrophosphatase PpaX|nr:HAD family hydrolase [Bacillota bacterium]
MAFTSKAVVFDLDGTLLNTYRLIFDSFNYAWAFRGIRLSDEEIEALFGPPEAGVIQRVIGEEWREGLVRFHRYYQENHDNVVKLAPYWPKIFSLFKNKGYYVALFTGKGKEATTITLARTGLAPYFDSILTGTEVKRPKPDPEGILITAQRIRVEPEEIIYMGDTWVDVKAAHSVGAKSVLTSLYHSLDEEGLKLNPDWVIRTVEELRAWATELAPVGAEKEYIQA